jgi:hypothetical protein
MRAPRARAFCTALKVWAPNLPLGLGLSNNSGPQAQPGVGPAYSTRNETGISVVPLDERVRQSSIELWASTAASSRISAATPPRRKRRD